jgi:uncharacterized protein YbjT (DUF2867 family)
MQKTKLTLFGATGKTGAQLIEQALRCDYELTLFVRSGTSFDDARVRIVKGDLLDPAALDEAIAGSAAVLSALGPTRLPHPKDLPITRATGAIIQAMARQKVRRLIAVSTGTAPDPADKFDFKINAPAVLIKLAMRPAYNDMIGLAEEVRASDLDWTMVRSAVLNDKEPAPRLNVGLYGHVTHSLTLPRASLAQFMLDQVTSNEFVGKAPGVSARFGSIRT